MIYYNFAFFGGQRENHYVSGHVDISIIGDMFAVRSVKGYRGFNSVGEDIVVSEDEEQSFLRDLHDQIKVNGFESESETKEHLIYHPIKDHFISANVQFGDRIEDLRSGKIFTVQHWMDLGLINRNMWNRLVDRPHLHPPPRKLNDLKQEIEAYDFFSAENYWKDWEETPKKTNLMEIITMENGDIYKVYSQGNGYLVEKEGCFRRFIKSSISAPLWEELDILVGKINFVDGGITAINAPVEWLTITGFDGCRRKKKCVKTTDEESYDYNNAMINLFNKN